MKRLEVIGNRYGRLTVIADAAPLAARRTVECRCDCGKTKVIRLEYLRSGTTKSCGCLNDERRSERAKKMYEAHQKYTPSEGSAARIWRANYSDGLSLEDFMRLSQQDCHYCGSPPSNEQNCHMHDKKSSQYARDNGTFIYNGLDRLDSSLDHKAENVVPCCWICNRAKNDMSHNEFVAWLERVIAFRTSK